MIMSLYPYFAEFEKILSEIYHYSLIVDENCELIDNILNEEKPNSRDAIQSLTVANLESHIKNDDEITQITIPIDKIIENLLIELPVPPRVSSVLIIL